MIFKNQYGSVKFWRPIDLYKVQDVKNVAVTLSGGTDSSFVMFMLCEYITQNNLDLNVLPFTGIDYLRPTNEWNAREISSYFKNRYPNINFLDHYTFKYHHQPGNTNMKRKAHRRHEMILYEKNDIKIFLCGKSANPPKQEAIQFNMYVDREEERDEEISSYSKVFTRTAENGEANRWIYRPLAFLHKKFVAQGYKDYNLMEDLFPLTSSCISYANKTKYFTEPCRECWWCKEKHWAFGMYDGGLTK